MKPPKGKRSRMQKKKRIRTKTIPTAQTLMTGRHRWRSLLLNLRLERPMGKALRLLRKMTLRHIGCSNTSRQRWRRQV